MTLDMDTDLSLALERLRNARTSRDKRDILLELKVRPPRRLASGPLLSPSPLPSPRPPRLTAAFCA